LIAARLQTRIADATAPQRLQHLAAENVPIDERVDVARKHAAVAIAA
jgi:hypothetical protein